MTDPTPTTTPTPPEGLTDERLLELMPEQFRADLATASRLAAQDAGLDTKHGVFRVILNTGALAYARAAIAAHEAQRMEWLKGSREIAILAAAIDGRIAAHEAARAQLPPDYIDPEQTGEDRKLLEAFYVACRVEGGTTDEITLRGIRAAIAADRAARPAPAPNELSVSLQINSSTESLKRLCDGLAAAVKPDGEYAAATSDDLSPSTGGEQMVQVEWWIPQHGCDSLENTLDAIKARILFAFRDWLATALAQQEGITVTTDDTP